jgi:hypothetical protein
MPVRVPVVAPDLADRLHRALVPPRVRSSFVVTLEGGDELRRTHSEAAPFKRVEGRPATGYNPNAYREVCAGRLQPVSFPPSREGRNGRVFHHLCRFCLFAYRGQLL